jgi:hypothetical protein
MDHHAAAGDCFKLETFRLKDGKHLKQAAAITLPWLLTFCHAVPWRAHMTFFAIAFAIAVLAISLVEAVRIVRETTRHDRSI